MIQLFVGLAAALVAATPQASSPSVRTVVSRAIDAVGGEAALTSIAALRIEASGHEYFIDQSERPEGPFVVRYVQTSELRDVAGGRSRTVITRERLDVVSIFGFHAGLTPWSVIEGAIAAAERGGK
jgi:hypothetical protein